MENVVTVPLQGGGAMSFEAAGPGAGGPVKAGRVGDALRELPQTLQECLEPVSRMARAVLDAVREAGPDGVEAEFAVTLSAQAGVVIAKGTTEAHLVIRVQWQNGDSAQDSVPAQAGSG
ncbi:CU044_2847 family protein [Streptomyces sp. CRN 30]|uniref:CU044_2847 family protein n=1 Tax=Streptomyces sp. CRN 30 TaxID=3075613 RepID=UPI002A8012F7|nr:CU044_2847 family protein [Streptomyces sp. CRN 30]